jgi:hypothetical protein
MFQNHKDVKIMILQMKMINFWVHLTLDANFFTHKILKNQVSK